MEHRAVERGAPDAAAFWNALRRCWPSVVPGLPPTGAAGVGSLKPTPAALPLTMVIVAAGVRQADEREQ